MLRKKIKAEVLSQGLSIYRLSQMSGLQITQINDFLKGKTNPTVETIERLLEALGVIDLILIKQSDL
jgi:transcriptional regulator with XRE-family HTH domain